MSSLKELLDHDRLDEAWHALREQARTESDFTSYLKLCQYHRKLLTKSPATRATKTIKLALLGGATTDILEAPLSLALESLNLTATIFHALGYAPETEIENNLGRPFPISRGRVLQELLG